MYMYCYIFILGYITNSSISVLNRTAVEMHWNKPYNGNSVPVQYNITIGSRTVTVIGSEYSTIINNLSKILLIIIIIIIVIIYEVLVFHIHIRLLLVIFLDQEYLTLTITPSLLMN